MRSRLRRNLILFFVMPFALLRADGVSAAQPIRIVSPASQVFAGQPVRFHIQAARLVSPQQATLYYRGIGTAVYKRLPMEQASPIDFKAVLPAAKVTPPGVQLFFVVVDGKGNTFTLPESNPQRNPYSIPIALDRSPPYVTGAWPAQGDVIQERRPRIEIAFEDAETRVHKASVRVILDDTDVTQLSEITEDRATFSPQTDLPDGSHVITVDLTDVCGNRMAPASWEFSVQGESDAQAAGDLYWDVEARRKVASPSSNVEPRWQLQSSGTLSTWMEKGPLSMTFDADAWYFDEEGPEPRGDLFTLNHFLWQAQYGKQQVQVGDVVVDGTELISPSIDRRGGHLALDIAGTRAQAFVLRSNYITGFDQGVGIGKSDQRIYGGAVERDLLDDQKLQVKVMHLRGENREASGYNAATLEGGSKGEVSSLYALSQPLGNALGLEAEVCRSHFDPELSDGNQMESDLALLLRAFGVGQAYDWLAGYRYLGPQYQSIADPTAIQDVEEVTLDGGFRFSGSEVRLSGIHSTDNVEEAPGIPVIRNKTGMISYTLQRPDWPILMLNHTVSIQDSTREPVSFASIENHTHVTNLSLSLDRERWNITPSYTHIRYDDRISVPSNDSRSNLYEVSGAWRPRDNISLNPTLTYERLFTEIDGVTTETLQAVVAGAFSFFSDKMTFNTTLSMLETRANDDSVHTRTYDLVGQLNVNLDRYLQTEENQTFSVRGSFNRVTDEILDASDNDYSVYCIFSFAFPLRLFGGSS
jgi:hypothetical protein